MENKKQSFVKGAAILGAAGIFIKILGAIFKLPLGNKLGDVGMSYFMAPYPIYNWLLVVSTAGIPTAIARMIAEKETYHDSHGVFKIISAIFKPMLIVSVLIFSILYFGADAISNAVGIPESRYAFRSIAPALLFVPTMSVFRGFFQGIQRMEGFAITQIAEQFFRVVIGLTLAFVLYKTGLEYAAAGATFGATFGASIGVIVSFVLYRKFKRKYYDDLLKEEAKYPLDSDWEIIKKVLIIAIPITIGASIMPTMNSVDLLLVVTRLKEAGFANAKGLYGILTGFAVTIVNFPQILTASLQISLVPAVTKLFVVYEKDRAEEARLKLSDSINSGIKLSFIIGMSCAIGLVTLSKPIMLLLYPHQVESAKIGAEILFVLAWDLIFLALYQSTTGILQGLKKQMVPAINLAIGMLFKIALTYYLVYKIGIKGAAISTIVAFAVASLLNVYALYKTHFIDINIFKLGVKPLISSLVMGAFVHFSYPVISGMMSPKLATLVVIILAAILFVFMILITNTLTEKEFNMIPGGSKLKKLRRK